MSTTIKTGWLNDKNGDKFAPKTLTSQVQTSDGVLLEDKIQADLDAVKEYTDTHEANKANPHGVTKAQVGLGNVDNTSDANKPVSSAQRAAIDTSLEAAKSHTDSALNNYYTKTQIDNFVLITLEDIDAICVIPLDPGLYQDGVLTVSWDELVSNGAFSSMALTRGILVVNSPDALVGELVIADNVLESYGFAGCSGLTKVVMPDSITSMSGNFQGCTALTEAVLSDGLASISDAMFRGCTALSKVELPSGLTFIGATSFQGCTSLSEFTIPDNGVELCANAFCESGLTSIKIPGSCNIAGERSGGSFASCASLTTVVIEEGITSIPVSTFYHCSALTNVTLPESITSIGYDAFSDCTSLTSINFTGTIAQWNSISKEFWKEEGTPLAKIICSDGTITL